MFSLGFCKLVAARWLLYIRIMQTALHIMALVAELQRDVVGGRIVSTGFYKKQRAAYLFVKKGRSILALGFVYHPAGGGCFCVPASKVRFETSEKPWPVLGLTDGEVVAVDQIGFDRVFEVRIAREHQTSRLVIEAIGPNGNLWLLDEEGGKHATLRNRKFTSGEPYVPAAISDRLKPFDIAASHIDDLLASRSRVSPVTVIKRELAGFNETMACEVVHRAKGRQQDAGARAPLSGRSLIGEIGRIVDRFHDPGQGYLYGVGEALEVYPFKLTSLDAQSEKFKSLSLAVFTMVSRRRTVVEEAGQEKAVLHAVKRAIRRLQRKTANIESDIQQATGFERHKQFGELLQLNRKKLSRGMAAVSVDNIMADPPRKVKIQLDPALSPNRNIESYFRQYRKGREGLELLKRRLEITTDELESLEVMQRDLEADFESASQRYQSELASLLPVKGSKRQVSPRLPYREATLSTGLTVFIGRAGADNDRTTFEFARPYELWFHTQQCAGSHVVMKHPNKSFAPSKGEIEEAAAIAAYYSRARNDCLVPVIYTHRKYVRKPRKAKPGLVTVEREKSVMVEPRQPQQGK